MGDQGQGRALAGYVLQERIAVGGMAEIYRAVKRGPGEFAKAVAIKMVLPDLGRDPQFVAMFLEEARLAARLSSPHLVQVFDFGEEGGTYYLVMEHVEGVDLATLLARVGALPVGIAVFLGRQLCAALADVHAATDAAGEPLRIVHRDVNPGNVLLSVAGDVKLGDFGIAKARARGARTERGTIKGKLAYLSPEQVRGDELDARADLYAVGLILFEALTGTRYLAGGSEADLLRVAGQPVFRAPSTLRAGVPAWIDAVLRRALEVEPAARYPGARQLDEAFASGGTGDLAAQRRELGELVARIKEGVSQPVAAASSTAPARTAAPAAGRPRTEVLQRSAGSGFSRWIVAALMFLLLAGTAMLMLLRRDQVSTRAVLGLDRDAAPRDAAHAAPAIDSSAGRDAAADTVQPRSGRRTLVRRAHDGAVARRGADSRPRPDARPPASSDGARRRVQALLAEVDRLLAEKGVLATDAPELFAHRRALARGPADEPAARLLRERARALAIDRAFVDAKLKRINSAIAAAKVEVRLGEKLRRRARQALSDVVTGRYTEANRELNAIAHTLER